MSDRATSQHQPPRLPPLWVLIRDILSFFGGWGLIYLEVSRPEVRETVLVFGGIVISTPGLAIGFSSLAEAFQRRNGTGDSPSPQVESASSSSSS